MILLGSVTSQRSPAGKRSSRSPIGGAEGRMAHGAESLASGWPCWRALVTSSETTSRASGTTPARPQVHSTPAVKSRAALAEPGSGEAASRRDRLTASLACRSAVTIRYHLAPDEIRRLLADWTKTADRFTCPHGRPVVLSMTEEDLEKYFKRR